jgi:secreted trypsin-like serine protease
VKVKATADHGPRYFLFGIVSVGVPSCGKFNLPAVYTNVSHYLPWILDNVGA